MVEKTVTVGDTEVQITETEDGFEVEEVDAEPGTVEHFRQEVRDEGDSLSCGNVRSVDSMGISSGKVRVKVENSEYDVMSGIIVDAREAGWEVSKIEFEYGYADFVYAAE